GLRAGSRLFSHATPTSRETPLDGCITAPARWGPHKPPRLSTPLFLPKPAGFFGRKCFGLAPHQARIVIAPRRTLPHPPTQRPDQIGWLAAISDGNLSVLFDFSLH